MQWSLPLLFFSISGGEIFVILLLVVMLFGADKLPEIARGLGKGIRQVRNAADDLKSEIHRSTEDNDLAKFKAKVEEEKKQIEEIADSVKRKL